MHHPPTALQIASRVGASLLGGWVLVWGFVTLGIALLLKAGMSFGDARALVYLLAFVVFLVAVCGAFAARTATRAWLATFAPGLAMTALAWWLTRAP